VTNTLAYCDAELVTAVKGFMVQASENADWRGRRLTTFDLIVQTFFSSAALCKGYLFHFYTKHVNIV